MAPPDDLAARALAEGAARHPELRIASDALAAYLEARAATARPEHAADLFLSCACVLGAPRAADAFVARFLPRLPVYLGKLADGPDTVAEVGQRLVVRLLVGEGDRPPRIGEYGGRGPLEGWVRMAATRIALNLKRGQSSPASLNAAVEEKLIHEGGDLAILKHTYREPFRRAVADATAALAREHRLLLRLHYVEGMTTARMAALHGVSRPTIVRRIAVARDALLGAVHDHLRASLRASDEELAELFTLVRSQLDVSLVRLLRETSAP